MGHLTLMLTWACDMRCAHCSQAHLRTHLDVKAATRTMNALHRYGEINYLSFTGGEPFLRYPQMLALAGRASALGLSFGVVTNGRWAKTPEVAREKLSALQALGLDTLVVSYDDYHSPFVTDLTLQGLLAVAASLQLRTRVYVSRGDATPLDQIANSVATRFNIHSDQVEIRDVAPTGHGAALPFSPLAQPYRVLDKTCPTQDEWVVWPNGELLPCCSAGTHAALSMGNVYRDSIKALVARRKVSRLQRWLTEFDLGDIVSNLPDPLRRIVEAQSYVHACHLCHRLMSDATVRELVDTLEPQTIDLIDRILNNPMQATESPAMRRLWSGPPVVVQT